MESRKVLKERMRIVCCLCYGKRSISGEEVVKTVEVTTRRCEGSPWVHSLYLNRKKDPQPESLGTLKLPSSFSLVGLTVSLVTVHLTDLCFLLFFFSVLGEVVAIGEDGPSAHGAGG